jgi:hypothetical protein
MMTEGEGEEEVTKRRGRNRKNTIAETQSFILAN